MIIAKKISRGCILWRTKAILNLWFSTNEQNNIQVKRLTIKKDESEKETIVNQNGKGDQLRETLHFFFDEEEGL